MGRSPEVHNDSCLYLSAQTLFLKVPLGSESLLYIVPHLGMWRQNALLYQGLKWISITSVPTVHFLYYLLTPLGKDPVGKILRVQFFLKAANNLQSYASGNLYKNSFSCLWCLFLYSLITQTFWGGEGEWVMINPVKQEFRRKEKVQQLPNRRLRQALSSWLL